MCIGLFFEETGSFSLNGDGSFLLMYLVEAERALNQE